MNNDSLVSIITPAFNSASFIRDTILSVINQHYQNWEMIIVSDNSTDNTIDIVMEYEKKDERISLISLDHNVGAAAARNIALNHSKGRFIAFLDSDDLWFPEKLTVQYEFMIKNGYAFTFTGYITVSEDGTKELKYVNVPKEIDYKRYLRNTIIGCLTVMIDREQTGPFKMPLIASSHDMALWLEIMKRGFNAIGIQQPLAKYRLVTYSNTSRKIKAAKDVWKVYRQIEKLSLLSAIYNFSGYAVNALRKRL